MKFDAKPRFFDYVRKLQDDITSTLEALDGRAEFREDTWERPDGGGGWSRVLEGGAVFEKAGVNVSAVHGPVPEILRKEVPESAVSFYATGISLVIHPVNPMVPTTHANYRYFQVVDASGSVVDQWFGGGADLTPYYLFEEDAVHFHQVQKAACDTAHPTFYPRFKQWCDDYFWNHHRGEGRGIGGIFYDHLRPGEVLDGPDLEAFARKAGAAFLRAYAPIVERRMNTPYTEQQKYWQELRRGRYVEFNLIHDRGTLFGLKTGGRIESILMSLPPKVRWDYDVTPSPGSPEAELVAVLKSPKNWLRTVKIDA